MAVAALDPELFLPEPEQSEVKYTIISGDDHVVEPPWLFERYLPRAMRERGPQLVETPEGHQVWQFEGEVYSQVGMNAVAGRRPETVQLEPFRFEQMRPGCYDIDARIADIAPHMGASDANPGSVKARERYLAQPEDFYSSSSAGSMRGMMRESDNRRERDRRFGSL